MFSIHKGFTLIEMLIVLTLIGLFVAAASYLTHDNRIAQQKAERLADTINTSFRTARTSMSLGKGVSSGSTLTTTDKRVISIGSNGIATIYGTTNTGTESNLPYPFYDNDPNYKITDISISSGILINGQMPIWDQTGVTAADIAFFNDGGIQITSSDPSVTTRINAIRITAGYEGFEQSVMIDRIMGRSEMVSGKGESTFLVLPPTPINGACNTATYSSCIAGMPSGGNPGSCGGSASWICLGQNGGSDANCSKFNTACVCDSVVPTCSPTGCLLTHGFPPVDNQAWVKGASDCGFSCTGGYTGNNCEVPPPNGCNTTLPACNGATCSLTYLPSSYNQSWVKDAGSCGFSCTGGYTGPTCTTPPSIAGFTTTWKVGTVGFGNGDNIVSFTIVRGAGAMIDWGDGIIEPLSSNNPSHTYLAPGDYSIKMSNITAFRNLSNNNNNFGKLIAVNDWGGIVWGSMSWMFAYADHLNQLPIGAPNMTSVTDMSLMFYLAFSFNQSVANFNTSNVTNMQSMFAGNHLFNQSVANFNTSNVTNMSYMFNGTDVFDQSVANFDTSKVTNMRGMFAGANAFNQSVANFDTSKVTDMGSMFNGAYAFNQSVASFNTSLVTNMSYMFAGANAFNQSVASFNTSNVTDMSGMFRDTYVFNQSLATFNTSNVTNMYQMFLGSAFNQSLATFNTSNVTNMNRMFSFGSAFNQSLATFNTSKVTDMEAMFANNVVFNQPLSTFNTSLVTNMQSMFQSASAFNQNISNWCVPLIASKPLSFDISGNAGFTSNAAKQPTWGMCPITGFATTWKVGTPGYGNGDNSVTFYLNTTGNYTIDWGDGNVEILSASKPTHTYATTGNKTITISGSIQRFYTTNEVFSDTASPGKLLSVVDWGNMAWTSFDSMFFNADHLTSLPLTAPNLTNVTNMYRTFFYASSFNQDISNWNVSNVTTMWLTFNGATSFNQPLNSWNMSNVTTIYGMFTNATSFNQPLNSWNTSNVVDMGGVFVQATAFNQDISSWNTIKVTNMGSMFYSATSFNQPLNSWNTSSVTNMQGVFLGASSFNQPLNSWNTSNALTMSLMFFNASNFNQPLNSWNTVKVTDISYMFYGATSFNQPLNSWNTSNIVNMQKVFQNASIFNQPLNSWNTVKVTNMTEMFSSASAFNQNISNWCVTLIGVKPGNFDTPGNAGFTGNAAKQPTWGTCPATNTCTTPGYYSAPSGACYTPLQSPTGWRAAWDACYASGASIANAGAFSPVNYPCNVSGGCGPITGVFKIAWWGGAGDSRDTYDVRSCDATGCPQGAGTYSVDTYGTNPFPQNMITSGNADSPVTDTADGTHYYWCEIPAGSTYVWTPGTWGSCSATCGGGTQTRTMKCVRNDGHAAADALCTAVKPATSQGCNPQACGSPAYTACKGSPSTYLPSTTYNFTVGQGDTICSTAYGAGYVWARYTDMDQTLDTNMWNNNQLYVNWARANGSPSSCLASWDTTHRLFMASIGPSSGPGFGLHMIDAFNVSGIVDQTDLSTQGIGAPPNDATTPMAALCSGARPTTLPLVCCK